MFTEPALAATTCPVTRQLLGDSSTCAGAYGPGAKDVPLLHWLRQHGVDGPIGASRDRPAWAESLEYKLPPRTVREIEQAGSYEGDAGHTTASRPGARGFSRASVGGNDRQSQQEKTIAALMHPKQAAKM